LVKLFIDNNEEVKKGKKICEWDPYTLPVIAERTGTASYMDLVEGVSIAETVDDATGITSKSVLDWRSQSKNAELKPRITLRDEKGNVVGVAVQLIAADHAQNVFFGVKSSTLTTFAKANNVNFLPPNNREMSNEDLGQLITEATVFLECWMTVAKIKQIIAQEENRKAFYSEHK